MRATCFRGINTDPTATPHQYIGKLGYYLDHASGLQLLTQRYYDSVVGRFVSEDPVREGTGWFLYVLDRPAASIDPSGEFIAQATCAAACLLPSGFAGLAYLGCKSPDCLRSPCEIARCVWDTFLDLETWRQVSIAGGVAGCVFCLVGRGAPLSGPASKVGKAILRCMRNRICMNAVIACGAALAKDMYDHCVHHTQMKASQETCECILAAVGSALGPALEGNKFLPQGARDTVAPLLVGLAAYIGCDQAIRKWRAR